MRPGTPNVPPRGPPATATAAAPEDTKAAAPGPDTGRRGRVDASGRRSAAAQTLLGAVARALLDEDEAIEAPLGDGRADEAAGQAEPGAMPSAAGTATITPRPRRTTRAGARATLASSTRSAGEVVADRDLWSADVNGVEGPWAVAQTDSDERTARLRAGPRATGRRVAGIGFGAGLSRSGLWGALLAAVAALVLLTVAGGFDLGDHADERGGSQAPAMRPEKAADH